MSSDCHRLRPFSIKGHRIISIKSSFLWYGKHNFYIFYVIYIEHVQFLLLTCLTA